MLHVQFDHIAIATTRICDATPFLVGVLGGTTGYGGPSPEFRWWHWDFPGGGRIEVLEPDATPNGFVARFLAARGPGLHHLTFKVSDFKQACARAEALGYAIVGRRDGSARWQEAFLHPKQAMGIVVQLAGSAPSQDEDEGQEPPRSLRMEPPTEPARAPVAARVVGIRLRSASRERAIRQWRELLKGRLEERSGELRFSWPDSAMRVRVVLDPASADRSEAIELLAPPSLALPTHAQQVLFDAP